MPDDQSHIESARVTFAGGGALIVHHMRTERFRLIVQFRSHVTKLRTKTASHIVASRRRAGGWRVSSASD